MRYCGAARLGPYEHVGQASPAPLYCNFALDAGFFCQKGIESVMLGPGEIEQFHSSDEYVAVDDLTRLASIYYNVIETALA
jgi:acetylornithine deacetylase